MNRSNYRDDFDGSQEEMWQMIRWRGAVTSAIRGKRGQAFLRELADYLDAMPVRELAAETLEAEGKFCALGVACAARGIDTKPLTDIIGDPDGCGYDGDVDGYGEAVADKLGIANALAREIMFVNDDAFLYHHGHGPQDKPERIRWRAVRQWVESQIKKGDS